VTLALVILTALAQADAPPPPPAPLVAPTAEPFVSQVPDDQVPTEDKAPPEFPRVIRRDSQICQQSVTADGQIATQCRPGRFVVAPAATGTDEFPKFTGALGAMGSLGVALLSAGTGVAGGFDVFGDLGARFSRLLGAVLAVNFGMVIDSGGTVMKVAFAPGIRIGGRVNVVLAIGPSIVVINASDTSVTTVMGSFMATGVFPVAGPFSLFTQAGITFTGSLALINVSGGLGVSF
jgi:hypothetical protein